MKKFLFLLISMLFVSMTHVVAQEVSIIDPPGFSFDFTTITGLIAFVTWAGTELFKFIPSIKENRWLKVLCSIVIGVASAFIVQRFNLAPFLDGEAWYKTLAYGAFSGASASGVFSWLKPLFTKNK